MPQPTTTKRLNIHMMSPNKAQQASLNHTLAGMNALTSPSETDNDEDRADALLKMSIALIESAIDILTRHIQSDNQLTQESILMPGGTLGKHFRHVIETYRAFLLPLLPRSPSSSNNPPQPLTINYDAILPSTRKPLARSIPSCLKAMEDVKRDLTIWGNSVGSTSVPSGQMDSQNVGKGLEGVTGVVGSLGEELSREVLLVAITPTKQEMKSSLGRELWFCSLHAIHHFSMLRTIAVHELGLDLPVEFGTAPSTLLYRPKDWKPPIKKRLSFSKSKL